MDGTDGQKNRPMCATLGGYSLLFLSLGRVRWINTGYRLNAMYNVLTTK